MSDSGGGKGVNVDVNFKDVWSAVHDVGDWYSSEATFNLVNNAFVIPKGVTSPNELEGWIGEPHVITESDGWSGKLSDTDVRFGVVWYYGGQYNGQGRYIGNADVFFVIDEIGSFEKFRVDAAFDNPIPIGGGVAQLSGELTYSYYEWGSLSASARYQWFIRGDGAGKIWAV